ncbi:MAG TPA: abortive infection system antitoxin AbiGi family protein [Saprospiraceae bacterium]|nr:abortive infection system antitoxin AbiGi family protein [Saprospiraceae bacterium]
MGRYPNIIFHFTKEQHLYSILERSFKMSYAREKVVSPAITQEFAAPMVSFCDLNLSELKDFTSYGSFGIGLTKEWANRKKLNPVFYLNDNCNLGSDIITGLSAFAHQIGRVEEGDILEHLIPSYHKILNIYRYLKNYEGELWRYGKIEDPNYRFADEREWRFVPEIDALPIEHCFVPINRISTTTQKNAYNKLVAHISLEFEPDDIKYLLVEKEDDIIKLINHLKKVKGKFSPDTVSVLSSRIITIDQIKNDV